MSWRTTSQISLSSNKVKNGRDSEIGVPPLWCLVGGQVNDILEEENEEGRKDVFRMLKKNFSIEQIADIKGMKVEEVRVLAAEAE